MNGFGRVFGMKIYWLISASLLAAPAMAMAQASEDLKCYSAVADVLYTVRNDESRSALLPIQSFYRGRLSIIEPNTDWGWVAASEKHLSSDEAAPIIKGCAERESKLIHLRK